MKKRILAALLCVLMLVSLVPSAMAANDKMPALSALPEEVRPLIRKVEVGAKVEVQRDGDTNWYDANSPMAHAYTASDDELYCNWRATIDMANVRKAFTDLWGICEDRLTDYDKLWVSEGCFKVEVKFPTGIDNTDTAVSELIGHSGMADFTKTDGSAVPTFYVGGDRDYNNGILTITVNLQGGGVKGAELAASLKQENPALNSLLCDLVLTCKGVKVPEKNKDYFFGGCIGVSVNGNRTTANHPDFSDDLLAADPTKPTTPAATRAAAGYTQVVYRDGTDEPIANIFYGSKFDDAGVRFTTGGGGGSVSTSHSLRFVTPYGAVAPITKNVTFTVKGSELPTPTGDDIPNGVKFIGWFYDMDCTRPIGADDTVDVKNIVTIYGKWDESGNNTLIYNIPYATLNRKNSETRFIIKGKELPDPTTSTDFELPEGVEFGGWFYDPAFTQPIGPEDDVDVSGTMNIYGKWINTKVPAALSNERDKDTHFAYIIGYPEGDVRPEISITRDEIATIFHRLLNSELRDKLLTDENKFSDSPKSLWSNKAISTMANGGYVTGYPDGTYKPDNAITRAEFVTIAARFEEWELPELKDPTFNDIQGHWAEKYIEKAVVLGWITGYEDGSFKPDQFITRAEAMTIYNRVLNRHCTKDSLLPDAKYWPDNLESKWYYYEVEEATNFHKYDRLDNGYNEKWTEITTNQIWIDKPHYEDPEPV